MTPPQPPPDDGFTSSPVYDSKLKEFFFSNPALSTVEAYSTVDGHRVGSVTVPGPMGLSLSPDGTVLGVGTNNQYVFFVDPAALHVTGQVEIPPAYLIPITGLEPVLPYLMASGPMLIALGNNFPTIGSGVLISYDRSTGRFANANPPGTIPGLGIANASPARSLDGNYLAVPTEGQTNAQLALYSAAAGAYVATTPNLTQVSEAAANPDGSQFATSDGQQITFWSRTLQQQSQVPITGTTFVYSRDGKYLYLRNTHDPATGLFNPYVVAAVNAQTGALAGYQGLSLASSDPGIITDVDESYRVFGSDDTGVFVVSAAQLQSTAPLGLVFNPAGSGSGIGSPNEGLTTGGAEVEFSLIGGGPGAGTSFPSSEEAYFATKPATKDTVGNVLTATDPGGTANTAVTVLLTDANNNAALLPNAYSYGPHVNGVFPTAFSAAGGESLHLFADGLSPNDSQAQSVTIGGIPEPVASTGIVSATDRLVNLLPGTPGWADLTLKLMDGSSETAKRAVQFLTQDVTITTEQYTSAVYDSSRDRFYLVGADNKVAVFDPSTQKLATPMQSSHVSSSAVLGSAALTPDNSTLVVSDPTDHSVVVFNLANGTSSALNVLVASDPPTVSNAMPVVAMAGSRAFVLLTFGTQNVVREIDLSAMTVQLRNDVPGAGFGSAIFPSSGSSSADGSVALFVAADSGTANPPFYVWKYSSATDLFSTASILQHAVSTSVATNADGSVLVAGALGLGQDLLPEVPYRAGGELATHLTASGGLRYSASGAVNISDTRNGRLLLSFPLFNGYVGGFAIDPTGRKILACEGTSLHYYELSVIPLAAGTVTPAEAAPGQTVTIRGDGFVSGTSVTIGGQSTSCTMVDQQTLQCTVPSISTGLAPMTLMNPDGQTYSFESAIVVQ